MAFEYVSDDAGRTQLILVNEPDFVVALPSAPPFLEDHLKQGKWLVISMAEWTIHDLRAGHHAIKLLEPHRGYIKLGLRLFYYLQEHATWVPGLGAEQVTDQVEILVAEQDHRREVTIQGRVDASPVWVAISEGKVVSARFGQLADAEIEQLISQLLSFAG